VNRVIMSSRPCLEGEGGEAAGTIPVLYVICGRGTDSKGHFWSQTAVRIKTATARPWPQHDRGHSTTVAAA